MRKPVHEIAAMIAEDIRTCQAERERTPMECVPSGHHCYWPVSAGWWRNDCSAIRADLGGFSAVKRQFSPVVSLGHCFL